MGNLDGYEDIFIFKPSRRQRLSTPKVLNLLQAVCDKEGETLYYNQILRMAALTESSAHATCALVDGHFCYLSSLILATKPDLLVKLFVLL